MPDKHLMEANERIVSIQKEFHVRKRNGKYVCYILEDKAKSVILIGQKLSLLTIVVNNDFVSDPSDKVSITGLWQIIGNRSERCNGWTKHKWRCEAIPFEDAPTVFNEKRKCFGASFLVGQKNRYTLAGSLV